MGKKTGCQEESEAGILFYNKAIQILMKAFLRMKA